MRLVPLLLLVGCAKVTCGDGTVLTDGTCVVEAQSDSDPVYEPTDATFADAVASLPECVPSEGDGRIDLATGCADDVCGDMTASEITAVLGDEPNCEGSYFDPATIYCHWDGGLWASFDDVDLNGMPDPVSVAGTIYLEPPYEGATVDGLGLGATWSCFFDALGPAEMLDLWSSGDDYTIMSASWWTSNLYASDFYGTGAVDTMGLSTPY